MDIRITDSLSCIPKINIVNQLHSNKKTFKKESPCLHVSLNKSMHVNFYLVMKE